MAAMASRTSPGRQRGRNYSTHFLESIRPEGIVCLECGKLLKALGTHVILKHEMTLDDYREKWGFNRQTVFVAASTAAKLRRAFLHRPIGRRGSGGRELLAAARAVRRPEDLSRRPEARLKQSESMSRLYASGWQPLRFRKVDDRTLRRMAKGGVDSKRIAREAGLSIDQTRRRLQALGLLPPARRRRTVNREQVLGLRREGFWPLEIARKLRIQRQHVLKILWEFRRQGIAVPTPARPRPNAKRCVTEDEFLRAFRRGGTTAQIAARLGESRRYVVEKTWLLRRRGIIAPLTGRQRHR